MSAFRSRPGSCGSALRADALPHADQERSITDRTRQGQSMSAFRSRPGSCGSALRTDALPHADQERSITDRTRQRQGAEIESPCPLLFG